MLIANPEHKVFVRPRRCLCFIYATYYVHMYDVVCCCIHTRRPNPHRIVILRGGGQSDKVLVISFLYDFIVVRAADVLMYHVCWVFVCWVYSVSEVVCFGEGAGANILARFAVSIIRRLLLLLLCTCSYVDTLTFSPAVSHWSVLSYKLQTTTGGSKSGY